MFIYIIMLTYFACITFSEAVSGNPNFNKPPPIGLSAIYAGGTADREREDTQQEAWSTGNGSPSDLQRRRDFSRDLQHEEEADHL